MKSPVPILSDPNIQIDANVVDLGSGDLYNSTELAQQSERTLAVEHKSITYQFEYNQNPAYLIIGLFDDGTPGKLLIHAPHLDPEIAQLLNIICDITSSALGSETSAGQALDTLRQYQHPLIQALVSFIDTRFDNKTTQAIDSLSKPVVVELSSD